MERYTEPGENHDDPLWEGLEDEEDAQICVRCMRPVSPRVYYCPHCLYAVNQMTPYLPFINIWFYADFIGSAVKHWKRSDTTPTGVIIHTGVLLLLVSMLPLVAVYFVLAAAGKVWSAMTKS